MAARDFTVDDTDQVLPPTSRKIYVALDENGQRVGETHHNADLTDHEVDLIRELHEKDGMSYDKLAEKFECSKSCIQKICNYSRRASSPARYRAIILHIFTTTNEGGTHERPDHRPGTDTGPTGRARNHRKAGLSEDARQLHPNFAL